MVFLGEKNSDGFGDREKKIRWFGDREKKSGGLAAVRPLDEKNLVVWQGDARHRRKFEDFDS